MLDVNPFESGKTVEKIMARTKKPTNQGNLNCFLSFLKIAITSINGIIHNILTNLAVVANSKASLPYTEAAPTTELVS